jgi:hypothetical protein
MVTSKATPTLDAENSGVLAEAGQSFSQGIGVKPVLQAEPERGDNDENVSSNPKGKVSGFPDSGAGPGTGLVAKSGIKGGVVGVHKGTGVSGGNLPPGFAPRK